MSSKVLQMLAEKENHKRFSQYIKPHVVSKEVAVIIASLGKWYESHGDVDWQEFNEWFSVTQAGAMKPEKLDIFHTIFDRMDEFDEEPDKDIVQQYINQDYCTRISEIALKGAEGSPMEASDIEDLVNEWHGKLDSATELSKFIVTASLDSIIDNVNTGGLNWKGNDLNASVGTLRKGKLVCFAARPNVGKTTFLATQATHFAKQIEEGQTILWFNNEEEGSEVKYRVVQAALGATNKEIEEKRGKAIEAYQNAIGDKIVIVDKADATTKDIEEYIRMYPPAVIIFDQLWKVHGFEGSSGNETSRLHQMFMWAREMAKKHAPVITVHQVKTEGEGQAWLTPDQLYLSGTAIQGEVDTLLMMGRSYGQGKENERYLSIGKNKGAYGSMVDTSLREGQFVWEIDAERAKFIERGMR
jgi:KaiC/GvpD/RAD55 family RecA-like ATPase